MASIENEGNRWYELERWKRNEEKETGKYSAISIFSLRGISHRQEHVLTASSTCQGCSEKKRSIIRDYWLCPLQGHPKNQEDNEETAESCLGVELCGVTLQVDVYVSRVETAFPVLGEKQKNITS